MLLCTAVCNWTVASNNSKQHGVGAYCFNGKGEFNTEEFCEAKMAVHPQYVTAPGVQREMPRHLQYHKKGF